MLNQNWQIKEAKVSTLKAVLIQPFRTALGEHQSLDNLLFTVKLTNNVVGYGEAAVATHITGETVLGTERNLKAAAEWLAGKDLRDYLKISHVLHDRWGKNPAMIAAVEMALFDALAKKFHCPLWRFFGPCCRKLKSDITIVIADLPETESSIQKFYHQGFRSFKVKIGRDFDLDIKRVAAVWKMAPKSKIYLDANQGFSADEMLKFLTRLKRLRIRPDLLEQPVPRDDYEGLIKISKSTDIPVCADESVRSIPEAIHLIQTKAVDVFNIKLMKFGMVHAYEIVKLAKISGVRLMIGGMLESSLAMTAAGHLAAGSDGFDYVDLDTPFFIQDEAQRHPYLSFTGVYDLHKVKEGIGVTPLNSQNLS